MKKMIVSVLAMILLANVCIQENAFSQQIIYKDTQIQQAARSISVAAGAQGVSGIGGWQPANAEWPGGSAHWP